MKSFKLSECDRQMGLMSATGLFDGDMGGGRFFGKPRPFVLADGRKNLYGPVRGEVLAYFKENRIAWWGGASPTGHILSSQMACLNHLFALRTDAEAVLALLNGLRDEFAEVLPAPCDARLAYIAFEVVSRADHLNEGNPSRGTNCTSIDALVYARHRDGSLWLIPIEWKYTEAYAPLDKSAEDHRDEPKGNGGKGRTRLARYSALLDESEQLRPLDCYKGSVYFQEPFYQLMRQTLWAEAMVRHRDEELLKADHYLHVHVVPRANHNLLDKVYKVSGRAMEPTWRAQLRHPDRYLVVDPEDLLQPVAGTYSPLCDYLRARYWDGEGRS